MELSSAVFSEILSPQAFIASQTKARGPKCENETPPEAEWEESCLNPQYRIDSLYPHSKAQWILHGVDVDGRRLFAVPEFAIGAPPTRIDVHIPPVEEHPCRLREVLESTALICSGRDNRIQLPICQHIQRGLESWASGIENFEQLYFCQPYGSHIIVTNIANNYNDMDIHLAPIYAIEQGMLSINELQAMWDLTPSAWPSAISVSELQLLRRLNEAITIVRIPSRKGDDEFVFKSLTRDQRYMFNELKVLLTLPRHPNIIAPPLYVVTAKSRFGSKHGVCGFILEFFPLGSLKERLSHALVGSAPPITLIEGLRWAVQITRAMMHVNTHPSGFYPDLKPDNIVFRPAAGDLNTVDAVLLDLEQRGGWFSCSPPEIVYVQYLEILAAQLEGSELKDEIEEGLRQLLPGWNSSSERDRYTNNDGGFSTPWLALLDARSKDQDPFRNMLEKAQVATLGKLLWCIFEQQPRTRCGIDHSILQEDHNAPLTPLIFPNFKRTPRKLQRLILSCNLGEPKRSGRQLGLILRGGRLAPMTGSPVNATAEETRHVAEQWWTLEIEQARRFLRVFIEARGGQQTHDPVLDGCLARPTFTEVLEKLEGMQQELE